MWVRTGNSIVHIEQAIPQSSSLQGVTIFDLDENFQLAYRTDAGSAHFKNNEWQFKNLVQRKFNPETGEMLSSTQSRNKTIPLDKTPEDFQQADPHEWELDMFELNRLAKKMQEEGYDATRYLVNMHSHIAAPFACIVMVLLGIPFALQRGRNSSLALGIVISVLVGVVYFILHSVAMAFGYSGILPPILATWSANILAGLTGLWLVLFKTQ